MPDLKESVDMMMQNGRIVHQRLTAQKAASELSELVISMACTILALDILVMHWFGGGLSGLALTERES